MATIESAKKREIKLILLAAGCRGVGATYGAVSKVTDLPRNGLKCAARHELSRYLRMIGEECRSRRLPPLDFMVVRKDTGQPGRGIDRQLKERTRCTDADLANFEKRKELIEGLQREVQQFCLHAAEHPQHLAELLRD